MFKKKYIMYCPVCGYVDGEHAKTVCPFCNHELKDSDHPLKEMKGKRPWAIEPIAEDIVQRLVKNNPDTHITTSCKAGRRRLYLTAKPPHNLQFPSFSSTGTRACNFYALALVGLSHHDP